MSDRCYMRELSLINRLETEKALIDTVNGVNTEVLDKIQKDFIKTFFSETRESSAVIRETLRIISSDSQTDQESVITLFRSFHTIKGLAGFVSAEMVRIISAKTELILDACVKGRLLMDDNMINIVFYSSRIIDNLCDRYQNGVSQEYLEYIKEHMGIIEEKIREVD